MTNQIKGQVIVNIQMIRKILLGFLICLISVTSYADVYTVSTDTSNFLLPLVVRGQRGWDDSLNNAITSIDTALGIVSSGATDVSADVISADIFVLNSHFFPIPLDGSPGDNEIIKWDNDKGRFNYEADGGGAATPAGNIGDLQYNSDGSNMGGDSDLMWIPDEKALGIDGVLSATIISAQHISAELITADVISGIGISGDFVYINNILLPCEESPSDNDIMKYDNNLGKFAFEADAGATTAAGNQDSVQYNSDGTNFGGEDDFAWQASPNVLIVGGTVSAEYISAEHLSAETISVDNLTADVVSSIAISADYFYLNGALFPIEDTPDNDEIIKYDSTTNRFLFEADAGATTAAGNQDSVQYNSDGTNFGGEDDFAWQASNNVLIVGGTMSSEYISAEHISAETISAEFISAELITVRKVDGTAGSIQIETYADDPGTPSDLIFRTSDGGDELVPDETPDGHDLGAIVFYGVDTDPAFDFGAIIKADQDGAAGATVPTALTFTTYSDSASNPSQLYLDPTGLVGVNTSAPTHSLDVVGNLRVSTSIDCATISADIVSCWLLSADTISAELVSTDALSADYIYLNNVLFPIEETPDDDDIIKYSTELGRFDFEADGGGSVGGSTGNAQYNADGSSFGGEDNFNWEATSNVLQIDGTLSATIISAQAISAISISAEFISADVISGVAVSADYIYLNNVLFPIEETPDDNDIIKYSNALGRFDFEPDDSTGTPAGNDTNVQFNNSGSFGGEDDFSYQTTHNLLIVEGTVSTEYISAEHISAQSISAEFISADVISGVAVSADYIYLNNILFPIEETPGDNEILKYSNELGRFDFEADTGSATPAGNVGNIQYNADGSSFGADDDLNFVTGTKVLRLGGTLSTEYISAEHISAITVSAEFISAEVISGIAVSADYIYLNNVLFPIEEAPADDEILKYNAANNKFEYETDAGTGTAAGEIGNIQYNTDGTTLGGDNNLMWIPAEGALGVNGVISCTILSAEHISADRITADVISCDGLSVDTAFILPASVAPELVHPGSMALEVDSNSLNFRAGDGTSITALTAVALPLIQEKSVTVFEPDQVFSITNDVVMFAVDTYSYPSGIKIVAIRLASSVDADMNCALEEWDKPAWQDNMTPVTCDTIGFSGGSTSEGTETTITDSDVNAGQYIVFTVDNVDIEWVHCTVWYYAKD